MEISPYLTQYDTFRAMLETNSAFDCPLSIAPLVNHTDRHFRRLFRLIAPHSTLYTEMLVAQAIVYGDGNKLLAFSPEESPVVAQLGGCDPTLMAEAANIAESYGYAGINVNLGCPSNRVRDGGFGARLMEQPDLVVKILESVLASTDLPVTVKCRIGTERYNSADWFQEFIGSVVNTGIDGIVIHARIADLSGKTTAYNLNVPPLNYDRVKETQDLVKPVPITLNGGLHTVEDALAAQTWAKRIMVGRMALEDPCALHKLHGRIFNESMSYDPFEILSTYREYVVKQLEMGTPLHAMTRHILKLFNGFPGARRFRRTLSTEGIDRHAGIGVFDKAISCIQSPLTTPILSPPSMSIAV